MYLSPCPLYMIAREVNQNWKLKSHYFSFVNINYRGTIYNQEEFVYYSFVFYRGNKLASLFTSLLQHGLLIHPLASPSEASPLPNTSDTSWSLNTDLFLRSCSLGGVCGGRGGSLLLCLPRMVYTQLWRSWCIGFFSHCCDHITD